MTLSEPVGYGGYAFATVVRGPGSRPRLSVGDLPRRWVERHICRPGPPRTPLYRTELGSGEEIRQGSTRATLTMPTRRDGEDEKVESVTFKIRGDVLERPVTRRVRVVD